MKNKVYGSLVSVLIAAAMLVGVSAQAEEEAKKGETRFAIGGTFANGMLDIEPGGLMVSIRAAF